MEWKKLGSQVLVQLLFHLLLHLLLHLPLLAPASQAFFQVLVRVSQLLAPSSRVNPRGLMAVTQQTNKARITSIAHGREEDEQWEDHSLTSNLSLSHDSLEKRKENEEEDQRNHKT